MKKIEKLNKILNNNGRLFKICDSNGRLFKIYSTPEEILYRITDDLEVERNADGEWARSACTLQDILNSSILLVTDDYTEEQKKICRTLYKIGYRYLARGENGSLYAFIEYPCRINEGWDTRYKCDPKCLVSYNFPEISVPITLKDIYEGQIL